jgi:type II secretion system (T2SS) protein F
MGLTPLAWLAAGCGITAAAGITIVAAALTRSPELVDPVGPVEGAGAAGRRAAPQRTGPVRRVLRAARHPDTASDRWRITGWVGGGVAVWAGTGWPAAGIAVAAVGVWSPWLLGSGRVARERIARLEALGAWCRRMADTLAGGGAVGLAQAIITSAGHAPDPIAPSVRRLATRLQAGEHDHLAVLAAFADELDDRVADQVAAALALALHQQSGGVARVLRQLADGVARDVRARRDIEAERAEARQSLRTLLLIQAGVLGLLALTPGFAAPYHDPAGQLVMAALLTTTLALLVWMRRLALGRPAPRFLTQPPTPYSGGSR